MKTWLTIVLPDNPQKDIEIIGNTTIGRASDNSIAINHPSVSNYQAVLEKKHQNYYISDLTRTNSTLLNETPVFGEKCLKPGDKIVIGVCTLIFHQQGYEKNLSQLTFGKPKLEPANLVNPELNSNLARPQKTSTNKTSPLMIFAAIGLGLLITFTSIFLVFYQKPQNLATQVHIISPASGTTIHRPVSILLEIKKTGNVDKVIYQLDSIEIAKCESPPYNFSIDPIKLLAKFPNLTNSNHILSITVEDIKGKKVLQSETLLLAFETPEQVATNTPPTDSSNYSSYSSYDRNTTSTPTVDINAMTTNLMAQIAQKSGYNLRPAFIERIRLHTSNYRTDTINGVRSNRREIIKAFRDKGLHPLLGFVLVMSESKFQPSTTSNKVGLWQIPKEIEKNYLLPGEGETTLNDPKRGSEVAAAYLKDLINVFGVDNFIYAIACYGQTLGEAGQLRTKLEASSLATTWQNDFWRTVETGLITPEAANHVVTFFAAGIVGENPQAFGLQQERLSSLY